jgi:hypothetical protein
MFEADLFISVNPQQYAPIPQQYAPIFVCSAIEIYTMKKIFPLSFW